MIEGSLGYSADMWQKGQSLQELTTQSDRLSTPCWPLGRYLEGLCGISGEQLVS